MVFSKVVSLRIFWQEKASSFSVFHLKCYSEQVRRDAAKESQNSSYLASPPSGSGKGLHRLHPF